MLLLTDRTRKVSAILSSVWMLVLTLSPTLTAVADDAAFSAGKAAGQTGVTQSMQVFQNTNQLQNMGITGLGTQSAPSNLTTLYKGQGKNGADSIGALNQAGVQVMQASQTCASTDAACQARKSLNTNYNNAQSGISSTAAYKQRAKAIQAAQSSMDPLAILGIGIPNAGGGSVCVQSTATVPSYQTTTSCLQATFQTLHSLPVLPVTTGTLQTSPYCIDPTMTLSSNQSLCSKTVYSCPNGGTLNGTSCVINSTAITTTNTRKVNQVLQESGWGNGGDRSINTVSDIDADYTISGCGGWSGHLPPGQPITLSNAYYNGNKWSCGYKGYVNGQVVIDTGPNSVACWDSSYNCVVSRNVDEIYALPLPLSGSVPKVVDGYIPGNGTAWNDGSAYIFGGALTYSVNDSFSDINAVLISADNNDIYRVDLSMDGVNWDTVADIDPGCCWGIFQNTIGITPRKAKYVRVYPVTGDGSYSIAELQLLSYTNTQCTNGGSLSNNGCSQPTYPATSSYQTASPGCMGAPVPTGAVSNGTQLVSAMVNGQAGLTCQTTYYSCPATMNMNGMLCEDPSKPSYQNPNCKYLGKDTNTQGETYLCLNNQLDECAALDLSQCTNTNNACIFTDNVIGSNTYGQCIATQKDYSCTVPAQTTTINQCGYDPMCYNGNCFTPPGTQCEATPTGDQCTTDLSQVLVSMETARQAGTYMNPDDLKIFKGEFSRCDRRAFSVLGAGLGSKSCCNISAPDAKSNADILGSSLAQSAGFSLLKQGVSKSSQYMYDYMMSSNAFMSAGNSAWAAGLMSDSMQAAQASAADLAAKGIENFTWTPSVSVAGVTASFGGVGSGLAGTGSWVGNALNIPSTSMLNPTQLGTLGTPFGDLTFSVDPVSLGIQAAWMAWQAYNAALACDEQDYNTATKTNGKLCYSTGTWCESKDCGIFGCTCTKYRTGKCCFNSKLSRIINEQGRAQLGLDMRDCGGFSTAQIQQLDWSRIDLSEFIADMLAQAQASTANIMNNAVPTLQTQTSTITTNNARNKVQPSLPIRQ